MSIGGQISSVSKTDVNSSVNNALNAAISIGSSAMHMLAPDNYEYYMCSLELIDCNKTQIGFISFVVMPNNLSESKTPIQTQTKTKNGIVTLFNDSFTPVVISLQGTFGRKFRIVTNMTDPSEKKSFFNGNMGKLLGTNIMVKSGYGLSKLLKFILDKSNQLDKDRRPYLLIFNNYAFNTSYVVDVVNYTFNQSIENNMLWFYDFQLKATAPGSAVKTNKQSNDQLSKTVASNAIAQGLGNLIKDVKRNNSLSYI